MPDAVISAGAVALGALAGGPARYFLSGVITRRCGVAFPWGTLSVNVLGAFAIGAAASYARARGFDAGSLLWLLAATGALGSFTTVSSFAAEARALMAVSDYKRAGAYVAASVILCVLATAAGFALLGGAS